MRDFDGTQVLYRLAYASSVRAAQRAKQSAEQGGDPERDARSFDARVEAVVLFQASAEAWINRLFETHGLAETRRRGWLDRWRGIGHVAVALGRPQSSLPKEMLTLLEDVSTIRNFLLHGDQPSRQRLEDRFGGRDLHDLLSVESLGEMFVRAEELWSKAREITGQPTPTADHAWVSSDEYS